MTETTFDPIKARQDEIAQYQANIDTYTAVLKSLPTEWPERLLEYRGSKFKHEVIAKVESLDDVALLSDLWFADECHAAIRTETLEMRKAQAILGSMN
jgi:hypothetical protein